MCIQAGLPPRIDGSFYIDLCAAVKKEVPEIHVHAFSPEEILYGATLSNRTIEDYVRTSVSRDGVLGMCAISRLMLDAWIRISKPRG